MRNETQAVEVGRLVERGRVRKGLRKGGWKQRVFLEDVFLVHDVEKVLKFCPELGD